MTKRTRPYGTWASPIDAALVAGESLRFGRIQGLGNDLYWTEGRPAEGGRATVVRRDERGTAVDLLPPPYSACSKVHEYGGGEMLATPQGLYFVNAEDQDVYRVDADATVSRITDAPGWRFADMCLDESGRHLIAVAEIHGKKHDPTPENLLVRLDPTQERQDAPERLAEGNDFYASPRLSPDGRTLAWLEWSLPHMPWEDATLRTGVFADGRLDDMRTIAGGRGGAVFQPEWGPGGELYFIWDKPGRNGSGWGNLHCHVAGETHCPLPLDAEFGLPLWVLGTGTYAALPDGRLFVTCLESGRPKVGILTPDSGETTWLDVRLSGISNPTVRAGEIAAHVASDRQAPAIGSIGLRGKVDVIRRSSQFDPEPTGLSAGQVLRLRGRKGRTVRALHYPPANADREGPDGEAPPMLVSAHGGPTGMADRGLKLKIQFWTSRGFAFLDVDYAGSWGYGRAYREALNGQWGVADVEDVVTAGEAAVARGLADPDRLLISGGSAGGFTVLNALAFHDLYAAGASYYGVADLTKLLALTHKFESGYLHALTGTEPGATETVFGDRSPLEHADRITAPVIFFQGGKDFVVPPDQSRDMAASLDSRGVPVAYLEFEHEGHGFRSADTIARCLDAEYAFYARVLGLVPEEKPAPVDIRNEGALP